jgi:hypothetical protein
MWNRKLVGLSKPQRGEMLVVVVFEFWQMKLHRSEMLVMGFNISPRWSLNAILHLSTNISPLWGFVETIFNGTILLKNKI